MKVRTIVCLLLGGIIVAETIPLRAETNDQSAVIAEMQRELKALRDELQMFKQQAAERPMSQSAPQESAEDLEAESLLGEDFFKAKGLTFGFYGESKYRFPKSGANSFDAHRYVLSPSYQIADWLVFNSELELEHGGVDDSDGHGGSGRSRFDGEIELEQFYVDILINDHFNVRSLGIDLVPVGRMNLYHEPTLFYSTERPELYREIIPTTWMEPSMSIFGQITETLDYRLMVSAGLEDSISSSTSPGIAAGGGMRSARPRLRRADENMLAYSGRLHYNGIRGLDASTSFYVSQVEGFDNQESTLALWDVEAIYRVPNTGLELRGDFAWWFIHDEENLVANNNASTTDDVGDSMYGWYVEAAYHFWPDAWRGGRGESMDLVPFARFSRIVTQNHLSTGNAALDDGSTNKDLVTVGLAWFLNENFVIKGDWLHNLDDSDQDYFQTGVGMAF